MKKAYEAPFRYDSDGQMIWDKNDMWSLSIRGWGHLTGWCGGMCLTGDKAVMIQDEFGERVTRLLNQEAERNEGN